MALFLKDCSPHVLARYEAQLEKERLSRPATIVTYYQLIITVGKTETCEGKCFEFPKSTNEKAILKQAIKNRIKYPLSITEIFMTKVSEQI